MTKRPTAISAVSKAFWYVRLMLYVAFALLMLKLGVLAMSMLVVVGSAQADAIESSDRYASPGLLESDVIKALGEPTSVYRKKVPFDRPISNKVLYYPFGAGIGLYVYVAPSSRVECSLVSVD